MTERLTLAGGDIEYRRITGDRPEVVFMHEGLGSMRLWRDFPDLLCEATGCGGFVWSRHGYGWSDPPDRAPDQRYMHHEGLTVLPELLEVAGLDDVVLVGHSDGASISLICAGGAGAETTKRIRAVVAIAPHVLVEDLCISGISQARVDFQGNGLRERLGRHHRDVDATFHGWNDVWLRPDFRSWNIEDYVRAITCPILVVQATDDPYGSVLQVERIEEAACGPVARLVMAAGGHAPFVAAAGEVIDAVVDFLVLGGPQPADC